MHTRNKPSKWLVVVASLGLAFGLSGETGELDWNSPSESLNWSALFLGFFFAAETLFALLERIVLWFGTRLQRVAHQYIPSLEAEPRRFIVERGFAAFVIFAGGGLAISSTWATTHEFWTGLPLIGGGLGLLLGIKTSRRILKLSAN